MRRAEKMIRQQIDELTMERIAFVKTDIENSIKWMYWSGAFSVRKRNKMLELLENKYAEVWNEFFKREADAEERSYQKLIHDADSL